jgi:hypothetical protein
VLVERAVHDPDPVVALWCARSLADPSGELPVAGGLRLLTSTRARVHAFAASLLTDDHLTRQLLHESLLDRSASVRFVARWRWRRRYGDPDRSTGRPWPTRAGEIARLLATSKLSDSQRREIAFVAGIRVPASSSRPD